MPNLVYSLQSTVYSLRKSFAASVNPKFKHGFTLVEILIFLLLVLALVMILLSSAATLNKTRSVNLSGIASKIASCEIESLRSLNYADLPANGSYPISGACDADYVTKLPEPKTGSAAIADYGSPPDPDIKQITIEITWTENGVQQIVKLSTLRSEHGIGGGTASLPPPTAPPPPPPPTVRKESNCDAFSTSTFVEKPTGLQNGDFMVLFIATAANNNTGNAPAGWTPLGSQLDNGTNLSTKVYTRIANGEPGLYTFDGFSNSGSQCVAIIAVTNVNTSTPVDDSSQNANASGNSVTATEVDTTVASTEVIFLAAIPVGIGGNFSNYTGSNPTLTEIIENNALGPGITIGVAVGTKSGIGSTQDRSVTWTDADPTVGNGHLIALRLN